MVRLLTPVLGILMLVGVLGCQQDKMGDSKMSDAKMMSEVDVCPSCRGVQKATSDGKCEACNAKLTDACSHCAGTQVATAAGMCPSCGKGVAK